jgi:hypothetical protein
MNNLDELKKKFFVSGDALQTRLETIIDKSLKHCQVDQRGQVHITQQKLPGRDQVMLVLAARGVASKLESTISADVTVGEIAKFTGLPENQVRARGRDLIESKLAESAGPGSYRALQHKIEDFLDTLTTGVRHKQVGAG